MAPNNTQQPPPTDRKLPQHGVNGVYYGGEWLDIENCTDKFLPSQNTTSDTKFKNTCASCPNRTLCNKSTQVRSRSNYDASKDGNGGEYDVILIGAGCIGSAIARELSKYEVSVLLLEAADDVSQGATKGNSGIVHAGYDDKPNTNRSKYCWSGNQMFPDLDKELRFGYQKNGSLVLATTPAEMDILHDLKKRGEINGVQRLQILNKTQVLEMEPAVNPNVIGALYSPDAGNVIPYEYAIALAENAVDNGVELRIRREVRSIEKDEDGLFRVNVEHWEPGEYVECKNKSGNRGMAVVFIIVIAVVADLFISQDNSIAIATALLAGILSLLLLYNKNDFASAGKKISKLPMEKVVQKCKPLQGKQHKPKVTVEEMFTGGSGSKEAVRGVSVGMEVIRAKYVINCAGGASDVIANMIGDTSFKIKPRLGDYLLLNRNQGYLTSKTIFPCPDPVLGKGVLVQTTLWGNLILGPTARDTYKPEARDMSDSSIQSYILSKCKQLCPYFDPKETFHAFCGARAKSDRGDWIIERSKIDGNFVNVGGIDSPGLAGSPAIAKEVVNLLKEAGLEMKEDPTFNPNRAPIITPKKGMRGLKMGPVGKNDYAGKNSDDEEKRMASNVICKCEKVTELEVVRALRRSLPIDSSQAIRKRTRAGMGHCQGDEENYNCECRVKAIIARESQIPVEAVGGRPWPATSTLTERWIGDEEKKELEARSK